LFQAINENGNWSFISTDYARQEIGIVDATLTNIEEIRVYTGVDSNNNNAPVWKTLDLVLPGTEDPTNGGDSGAGDSTTGGDSGAGDSTNGGDSGAGDSTNGGDSGTEDPLIDISGYLEIIGTDQGDEIDLSNELGSHYVELGQGDDMVIGTSSDDWFSSVGGGVDTINGGAGNDVAEVYLGNFEGRVLKIESNEDKTVYTISDIVTSDESENVIFQVASGVDIDEDGTVEADEFNSWGLLSTSYGSEVYGLGAAILTDIELIVVSYGNDSNNEPLQEVIELVGTPILEG